MARILTPWDARETMELTIRRRHFSNARLLGIYLRAPPRAAGLALPASKNITKLYINTCMFYKIVDIFKPGQNAILSISI
jgi:hypothetical protein